MSIVIISSDSGKTEADIANEIAAKLDYKLLGPEILPVIASRCRLETEKLTEALDKKPSFFSRESVNRWQYLLSCIEADVLDRLGGDDTVCWGLAAHLYVLGVSHALKVRIITGNEARVKAIMNEKGVSRARAEKILARKNRDRKNWSTAAFELDEADPSQYDLVINLDQIDPEEAAKTIIDAVGYRRFRPMTYSIKCLTNRTLAARVRSVLLKTMSDVQVKARDGTVVVTVKAMKREKRKKAAAIKELAGGIEGVNYVEVHLIKDIFGEAAQSFR